MIGFNQFLAENSNGTYASVTFTSGSTKKLHDLQKKLNVPNPLTRNKFHSTLIFSRKELKNIDSRELRKVLDTNEFTMREWEQRNGVTCLVITFHSQWMDDRHKFYRSKGGTHDFDSYEPHITLSYDITGHEGLFDGKVVNFETPLVLAKEIVEPLNTNWND